MAGFLDSFRPDMRARGVTDIDLARLHEQGFTGLLLDLDNTLLPWKNSDIPESSRTWIESAKQLGMKPCIVSNTHYPKRLNKIAGELGVPAVARALKPRAYGFDRAAEMIGCELARAVVVGDQLLTDIWGGNRAGAYTILVNPMHPREFIGTKVSRVVERLIFAVLGVRARV
jgi:HAD superfamily phosphatase (TIGR01668 family)